MPEPAADLDQAPPPESSPRPRPRPRSHALGPWLIAGTVSVVLLLLAPRYGYHRDELYFLLCGRHLDWGFVDQGPLTPAIAHVMDTVAPGSLLALRTPSALLAGISVLLVAAITRELDGGASARTLAAFLAATSGVVLGAGHLLTTTTFDMVMWLVATWCLIRMLRTGESRWALGVGLALGIGSLNKPLPALLAAGLLAGVAIAGPRRLLRDRWVFAAAALASLIAAPNIAWQAANGFPQLSVADAIANGRSSYSGRLDGFILQFLIISPVAAPIWIAGLVALLRRPSWRAYRSLAWAWIVAYGIVLIAGGKGYYDAPLLLALTAAGAVVTTQWWGRRRAAVRRSLCLTGASIAAAANVGLLLPVLPAERLPGFAIEINYDSGETIGWPAFTDSLAAVYRSLPADDRVGAIILTANYGEAGAVARYGPRRGLPRAYSGHNSMAGFGRPPDDANVVIAVGYERPDWLRRWFAEVTLAGEVDERVRLANDENHGPIYVCRGPLRPWSRIWTTEIANTG